MAIFLVYSISGITFSTKVCASSTWRPFWKIWNIKYSFNFTSDMKRSSQIIPKKCFHGDDVIDDVTWWPQSFPLYSVLDAKKKISWWWRHRWRHRVASIFSSIFMLRRAWLWEQRKCPVNECKYHNCLGYTCQNTISVNNTFRHCRSKVNKHHRLTGWPWHLNGHNSVNLGIIKMKQKLKCKK